MPTARDHKDNLLPLLAVLTPLFMFAALQVSAWMQVGGFEYPLDDVYIHLSMASEMARGGYGVNPGEIASAASSPLYPVLLIPLAGTDLHRFVPLLWNMVALVGAAWLFGRILSNAGYGQPGMRAIGITLALIGPLVLNMAGVAFTGMEHSLHLLASLAALAGLQRFVKTREIGALLIAGMVLGPLLRLEGLAISAAVACAIWLQGRRLPAIMSFAAALTPVILFGLWLVAMGLSPLPNSVMAKLPAADNAEVGFGFKLIVGIAVNLAVLPGKALLVIILALALALLGYSRTDRPKVTPFVVAGILAGGAHLVFGQIGWLHRYEHYTLVFTALSLLIVLADVMHRAAAWKWATATFLGAGALTLGLFYIPDLAVRGTKSAYDVNRQQAQMGRFVRDYLKAPIAANDLGWVSFQNPDYVLDLWGLASKQALDIRLSDPQQGWAAPLVEDHNVALIMIYDHWLGRAIGPNWVRIGALSLDQAPAFLAGQDVAFYAPDPTGVQVLIDKLQAFIPTLPNGAHFTFVSDLEGTQDD